jgi:predicted PurR-regulated permease PerM
MDSLPTTVRRSIELLGLFLLFTIFYIGREIIMPLLMAFFISLLLLPLFRFFRRYKVPEVLNIVLCILLGSLVVLGILTFFSFQIAGLVTDFPKLEENLNHHWNTLSNWVSRVFNISARDQMKMLQEQGNKLLNNAGSYLNGAALTLTGIFVFLGLLPIYIFLILFYKNLLLRFVFLWFRTEEHTQVESTLRATEVIIKSYLVGLMIQVGYMTVLLGGILMILGIPHALLIAILFAILNLIPYVGALIGNLVGVLLTLTSSSDLSQVLIVLAVIAVVQFLDNNILMPRIVGSKVKINALVSIIGVVVGGTLAGVSGMFLSLPLIAVFKIIFDHTIEFKHWGMLLGDERPGLSPMSNPAVRLRNRHLRTDKEDKEDEAEESESKEE